MKRLLIIDFIIKHRIKIYMVCGAICIIFLVIQLLYNFRILPYMLLYGLSFVTTMVVERSRIRVNLKFSKKLTLNSYIFDFIGCSVLLSILIFLYVFKLYICGVYEDCLFIICTSLGLISIVVNLPLLEPIRGEPIRDGANWGRTFYGPTTE